MNRKKYVKLVAWTMMIPMLLSIILTGCQLNVNLGTQGTTVSSNGATVPTTTTSQTTTPSVIPTETTIPTQPTEPTKPTQPTQPTEPVEPTVPVEPTEPTDPTEPTEPVEPEDDGKLPEDMQNHVYLQWMNSGFCETMIGNVNIVVVFVSDTVSSWDADSIAAVKASFDQDPAKLEAEAAGYGAKLDVQLTYIETKITENYDSTDTNAYWAQAALNKAGLGMGYYKDHYIENYYKVDAAPVVFVINQEGRAYAATTSGGSQFEYAVIFASEVGALRHEVLHMFGALDFYVPQETAEAANTFLPESIMINSRTGTVDELTAYLVGWTDRVGPKAKAFLQATSHITREYLEESIKGDHITGYGTKRFADCTYTGYMVRGVPHGEGVCTWDNGMVYTGTWENGLMSGYGELVGNNGYSYKGQWKDNQYNGTGTLVYTGGKETYTGEFLDGLRHGKGVHCFSNGDVYDGEWVKGIWTGTGKYTWSSGEVYEGEWSNALRHGQGTMTWKNGATYTGEWKNGKCNGYGVMTYADGSRYEGEFKNDKRHGDGTYYYTDGSSQTGRWENDKLVEEKNEEEEDPGFEVIPLPTQQ